MKKQALTYLMMFTFYLVYSTSITFSFDNIEITGDLVRLLEFDIMVEANEAGTLLGATQVYLEYDNSAFGENIAGTVNLEVSKGSLLQGEAAPGFFLYSDPLLVNNEDNLLSIQSSNLYGEIYANVLPLAAIDLLHFKITIQDSTAMSGISMVEELMLGQQYESDNSTHYIPIFYNGGLDIFLRHPAEPTITSIIRAGDSLTLIWDPTEAAIFYEVHKSEFPEGPFFLDTSGTIENTTWTTSINSADNKNFYLVKAFN